MTDKEILDYIDTYGFAEFQRIYAAYMKRRGRIDGVRDIFSYARLEDWLRTE